MAPPAIDRHRSAARHHDRGIGRAEAAEEGERFRAITFKLPWQPEDLLLSSNWLHLKTAGTNTEAIEILDEAGRTKRIRNTTRIGLNHRSVS